MSNKYGAKKVVVDGITFDSQREARRYADLKLLERIGHIKDLRLQVPFEFRLPGGKTIKTPTGKVMRYEADFVYYDCRAGQDIVEDVKGIMTDLARLKIALTEAIYGLKIRIVK